MPIISTASELIDDRDLAVRLPRYAQKVGIAECPFFGVNHNVEETDLCRDIWTKPERDMVLRYLAEAQEEIEQWLGFPAAARWIADDEQYFTVPTIARWGKIVEAGVRDTDTISLNETVDHAADPAVVGPIATAVTDIDEIFIYHPGTDIEIIPSSIEVSGGFVIIEIPRCRMVREAFADNDESGISYTTLTNFESLVDVKRVYNDASTNATIVYPHGGECCTSCSGTADDGCMTIVKSEIGEIDILPATYTDGVWVASSLTCRCCEPTIAKLNYRAGLDPVTSQIEDAIIRLAHSKMPVSPCACDIASRVWERDRKQIEPMTREVRNCRFGSSEGAWMAWQFVQAAKLVRGGAM